jgi:RNA polymerase sigma-70 factor (ECF subfamily)
MTRIETDHADAQRSDSQRTEEFMTLYSSHHQRLYLYIISLLPTPGDAEDVLQEASLVLWRKFDQFELGTNFYAWACKVTRNLVHEYHARRKRSAMVLELHVLEKLAGEIIVRTKEEEDRRQRALLECMDRLTDADRRLVQQRYAEEVSGQEIAAALGRSPNAISKALGRIRQNLLECIQRSIAREEHAASTQAARAEKAR